jgi:alpha-galactosidase
MLVLAACLASFAAVQTIAVPGTGNRIEYDLAAGTYSVYFNDFKVIADAYATANSNNIYNSTTSYTSRTYSFSALSDSLGTGKRHVIALFGPGQIPMQQSFYVYDNVPHFFVENSLSGSGSNCYAMSPLTSQNVDIKESADTRALFVPFDNDAWVRYNAKPLASATFTGAEVSAVYDDATRKGLVIGSISHTDWKTGITVSGSSSHTLRTLSAFGGLADSALTRDRRGHGWVNVGGALCTSPRIMVGYFDDWRDGLESFALSCRKSEPRFITPFSGQTPFGWNSWGAIQTAISLPKAEAVVDFFSTSCPQFRSGNTLYIDLDSYWDNMSDAELRTFCDYCKSKGFHPGIYWAPFVDWATWDRTIEGSTYSYSSAWTKVNGAVFTLDGGRAMDPTHPGTHDRIRFFVNRFKTAGFQMIKLDFLGHASIEADGFFAPGVHTGMQAFRNGMEYLCGQLGSQFLIYASICPSLATARYAHMRRIACDAYKTISETQYTLNSTGYAWWQSGLYDYIDADNVVFATEAAGANRARLASALVTGTVMTGDDYSSSGVWTARAQSLLQNTGLLAVAALGKAFRPVHGNTGTDAPSLFTRMDGTVLYCAIFNYSAQSLSVSVNPASLGLPPGMGFTAARELFSASSVSPGNGFVATVGPADASIYRIETASTAVAKRSLARPGRDTKHSAPDIRVVGGTVRIALPSADGPDCTVRVVTLCGQTCIRRTVTAGKGGSLDFSPESLGKGVYLIIVKQGQARTVRRILLP